MIIPPNMFVNLNVTCRSLCLALWPNGSTSTTCICTVACGCWTACCSRPCGPAWWPSWATGSARRGVWHVSVFLFIFFIRYDCIYTVWKFCISCWAVMSFSRRGFIFGLWSACASVGNILGAFLASSVLKYGYEVRCTDALLVVVTLPAVADAKCFSCRVSYSWAVIGGWLGANQYVHAISADCDLRACSSDRKDAITAGASVRVSRICSRGEQQLLILDLAGWEWTGRSWLMSRVTGSSIKTAGC